MILAREWLGIIIVGILASCTSHRNSVLLSDLGTVAENYSSFAQPSVEYNIKPRDLLFVTINFLDAGNSIPDDKALLEDRIDEDDRRSAFKPTDVYYRSYTVNDAGFLSLPIIGTIYVAGQTTNLIRRQLDEALASHFKLATSQVKLANMRVIVLGEVQKPGNHYYFNNQMNIFEAISLAGNFSEFADRKKVKLVRQMTGGMRSIILNLNKMDFLSPFFTIKPGDVIYVEPLKPKSLRRAATSIGLVLSAVSTAVLVARLMLNFERDK